MFYKAVLFDLDGVLVDACDWHYQALNRVLLEIYGFKIGRAEHESTFNGLPTRTKLEFLCSQGRVRKEDFLLINDLKQRYTIELINSLTQDLGKIDLHSKLRESGLLSACVTNSIRQTAEIMLRKTGQFDFLSFLVTNEDVKHPKPSSEGYILGMVHLNLKPNQVIIVEDSPKGLEAARNTGANVLQVRNASEVVWDRLREVLV